MKVFRLRPLEVEVAVALDRPSRVLLQKGLDGRSQAGGWVPPGVKLVTVDPDTGENLPESDHPYLTGSGPLFRKTVMAQIESLPGDFEVLPVNCAQADLFVVNATRVLCDAVDRVRSKVTRIPGKIVGIDNPMFDPDIVRSVPIFKLAELPRGAMYFNETWADRLRSLHNVDTRVVWDSEQQTDGVALS